MPMGDSIIRFSGTTRLCRVSIELVFQAGAYFRALNLDIPEPPFVDEVVLRFGIADAGQHYHVPLLVSPWAYSTYRGS